MSAILDKHLGRVCILLFLYTCWSYLITYTIYENIILRQAISLFIMFYMLFIISKKKNFSSSEYVLWVPFLLYITIGGLLNNSINISIYWFVSMTLLLVAPYSKLYKHIPLKLVTCFGIIMVVGIFFQIFFPDIYYSRIVNIFTTSDEILSWHGYTGYAGFTYQLGMTGGMLLIAEAAVYSLYRSTDINNKQRKIYKWLVVLFVIGVFMTGKRTFCLLSIIIPFLTDFLQQKNSSKKIVVLLSCLLVVYGGYFILANYPELVSDIKGLNRLADSIRGAQHGEDISSNRGYLYSLAWKAFDSNPILGVGVGNFTIVTDASTSVHNSYLKILCEQGILGFVLFLIPMLTCFITSVRIARLYVVTNIYMTFSIFIQLFFILYSFTGNTTTDLWGYVIYFIAIATMISVKYDQKTI